MLSPKPADHAENEIADTRRFRSHIATLDKKSALVVVTVKDRTCMRNTMIREAHAQLTMANPYAAYQ